MNELRTFIAMLVRAGIGHGTRADFNPSGTAVLVEHDDGETVTDWWFNDKGELIKVLVCDQ